MNIGKTLATIVLAGSLYFGYDSIRDEITYEDTSEYMYLTKIQKISIDPNSDWTNKADNLKRTYDKMPEKDKFHDLGKLIDNIYAHRTTQNPEYPYGERIEEVYLNAKDEVDSKAGILLLKYLGMVGGIFTSLLLYMTSPDKTEH